MSVARHRRNHAIAGLALVAAGLLIALAALKDLVLFKGVPIRPGLAGQVGIGGQYVAGKGADDVIRAVLLASAGSLAICGLLLLVTRVRYLGLLWRLLAVAGVAGPVFVAVRVWMFVHDPVSAVTKSDDPELKKTFLRSLNGGVEALGGGVSPAVGLYVLTAGSAVALLGLLARSSRRQVMTPGIVPA